MRRLLIVLAVPVLLATACRTGQTMFASCDMSGDRTGTDGSYVLLCRDGKWEPLMTVKEFLAWRAGKKVTVAPLPTEPTTTTTTEAPTTTEPPTTTTTVPGPLAVVTYNGPSGTCPADTVLGDNTTIQLCQGSGSVPPIAQVLHVDSGTCSVGQTSFTDITAISGTVTQGSTTIPVDLASADRSPAVVEWWLALDVANGPITFTLDTLTYGSTSTCL